MEEHDRQEILDDLNFLIEVKDAHKLRTIALGSHPADIADLLKYLDVEKRRYLFDALDAETASRVILELDENIREELVGTMANRRLSELVGEMYSDDAADFVGELPQEVAEKVLEQIEPYESAKVEQLLEHKADSAGGIMALEFIAVEEDRTVDQAIFEIRRKAEEVEEVYSVYVIDYAGKLVGVLPLKKLILSSPHTRVSELMEREVISVEAGTDQEEVAKLVRKYDLVAVPVVDAQGRLVGRITIDDVVDVIEEEASEDLLRMGGVDEDERVFNTPLQSIRRRLPWLYVNLLTAILAASVVGLFQATIARAVVLAMFMPIVAGMGGNAGTQTLTVIVRSLALGEVTFANARRALLKEVLVGLGNGFANGLIVALIVYFWKGNPVLGLVLGLAMIINMFVAALSGTMIPIALKALRLDPALASGVFVTTFTDVFGFFSFLGLATLFITQLM